MFFLLNTSLYDKCADKFVLLFHCLKDMAIDCGLYFGAKAIQVLKTNRCQYLPVPWSFTRWTCASTDPGFFY